MILVCIPGGFLIGGLGAGLARGKWAAIILGSCGFLLALLPEVVIICLVLGKDNCEAGKDSVSLHDGEIVPCQWLKNSPLGHSAGVILLALLFLPRDRQTLALGSAHENGA
jgi:hypothetical protein